MRKETCTYNELGEFLMVSGIGKRTGHSTLKNAKEKPLSPQYPSNIAVHRLQDSNGITYCLKIQLYDY